MALHHELPIYKVAYDAPDDIPEVVAARAALERSVMP
jgi:hypothetical protein